MGFRLQATCLLVSVAFFVTTAHRSLDRDDCPDKFLSFAGRRCLYVSTKYLNEMDSGTKPTSYKWGEARQQCLNMATRDRTVDLASLDSKALKQFTKYIVNEIPRMSKLVFHVGAQRDTPSGQWEWMNGKPVDPLSYVWNIDMPNNKSDTNVKGKLVPSGAYNRFYMVGIPADGYAPSFICEAFSKKD